jgi:hypothetical protein
MIVALRLHPLLLADFLAVSYSICAKKIPTVWHPQESKLEIGKIAIIKYWGE